MPTPLPEAALRDFLAGHLDLIEPGLELRATEHPVTNALGANGFIDILARDQAGDLVVIELKRADSSARAALHELEKYVALLASDSGIRTDQVRCIVASTTWHELLVPFARMAARADFDATGRLLLLGADGYPTGTDPVTLPDLDTGLEMCPLHHILLYATAEQRNIARVHVIQILDDLAVTDYITADLDYTGDNTNVIHPFAHYIALAEFPPALKEHLKGRYPDSYGEFDEEDWWDEQVAFTAVTAAVPADEVRVSTPARFTALDAFKRIELEGHGRFSDPVVWPAEELANALRADGATYSMPFQRQVRVGNRAAWQRMRRDLAQCLEGAGDWPRIMTGVLDELEARPNATVALFAFVPFDLLAGLEHLARTATEDALPHLSLHWVDGDDFGVIGGQLEWDGTTVVTSADQTLGKVFGSFENYGIAQIAGGLVEAEAHLCALHGLFYDIGEAGSWAGQDDLNRIGLDADGHLLRTPMPGKDPSLFAFIDHHLLYLQDLLEVFDAHILRL